MDTRRQKEGENRGHDQSANVHFKEFHCFFQMCLPVEVPTKIFLPPIGMKEGHIVSLRPDSGAGMTEMDYLKGKKSF